MPDLYTHEIPHPDDRAMHKFLWYGAFHDGTILSAGPSERHGDDLILRVEHGVLQGIAKPGTYVLRFHDVTHVESAGNPFIASASISDTLFLDSALLHAEERECQRRLYHLRFTMWTGYLDVVFGSFSIRLESGRVDYRLPEISDERLAANREYYIREAFADAQQQLALCMADVGDRDLDEFHATALWIGLAEGNTIAAVDRARRVLLEPLLLHRAHTYAAYVLGRHGSVEDLPRLMQLLLTLPAHECLKRRIVQDAIERIHERAEGCIP